MKIIEKVLNVLNTAIPYDKLLHNFYGNIIFSFSLIILMVVNIFIHMSIQHIFLIALILTTIVAISKEVYDFFNKKKHTPDYKDILYTICMPFIITIIIILILL